MYAKHQDLPADATFSTYFIGNTPYATLVGRIYTLETAAGPQHVAEAHDWDANTGEYLDTADGYDPMIIGVYADKAEAEAELEKRARAATEPEPFPGERPDTHVLADLLDEIVGDHVARVEKGEDVTLIALVKGESIAHARVLHAKLREALGADKGHAVVVRDPGVVIKVRITRTQVRALAAARAKR